VDKLWYQNYSLLIVVVLPGLFSPLYPVLRYSKYLAAPLALIYFISTRVNRFNSVKSYFNSFIIFYSILGMSSIIVNLFQGSVTSRSFANIYFIFSAIIPAYFIARTNLKQNVEKYIFITFWAFVASYFIEIAAFGKTISLSIDTYVNALYESGISSESGLSFVFCLYFIYFLIIGNKKYGLLSFLLTIFSFKRIAIAVIVFAIFYLIIPKRLMRFWAVRYAKNLLLFGGIIGYIYLAYGISYGYLDDFFQQTFQMSSNHFLQGRKTLYNVLFDNAGVFSWFGIGLGKIDSLSLQHLGSVWNIHSDILKMYYEFGIILFLIWIYLSIKFHSKDRNLLLMFSSMLILYSTDNVFIYQNVMFVFYLITTKLMMEHEERTYALKQMS